LREKIRKFLGVSGHVSKAKKNSCYQLRYGKREAVVILKEMYKNKKSPFLKRKKLKINKSLSIMSQPPL